jgi:hypothetical protein
MSKRILVVEDQEDLRAILPGGTRLLVPPSWRPTILEHACSMSYAGARSRNSNRSAR